MDAGLGASLAGSLASSLAGSASIAGGVITVSGMVRGGALVLRMSRRLGRVSRLEIEEIKEIKRVEFRYKTLGGGFGWSRHQSRVTS